MTYLVDLGKKALGDVGNPGDSEPCMGELQKKQVGKCYSGSITKRMRGVTDPTNQRTCMQSTSCGPKRPLAGFTQVEGQA